MRSWTAVITNLSFAALMFIAIVSTSGCALTQDRIDLYYVPHEGVAEVQGAENVRVKVEVSDDRAVKDKVSVKKNSYGMEMAAIISNRDVVAIVSEAIERELHNRGFRLEGGDLSVIVQLTKFYNDFKIGFWSGTAAAEVLLNVRVENLDGRVVFTRFIRGEGTNPGCMLASGKNAKIALEAALENAVSELMNFPQFIEALLNPKE